MTEGLCKHTDRRGRRSLQGQQAACSKIVKDNQFIFFCSKQLSTQGNDLPCLRTQSPSRLRRQPPLHKGALVVYNFKTTKKQKSSSITMPNSISQIFGQKIVGTGVPDGPPIVDIPKQS